MKASVQNEMAYKANFWISILHSLLNLGTGILGIVILFGQVETIQGWTFPSTLAILGVYLILGSLRRLFIGPSLETLAGMDGEVWSGKLDFTILRPIDIQFQASFRYWQPLALIDLMFGIVILALAMAQLGKVLTLIGVFSFFFSMFFGVLTLYSILLAFAGLVFWSPGFLFTWIFDSLFQMARYPVGIYPNWLRLVLTWIVPVGIMTTIPAEALTGTVTLARLLYGGLIAIFLFLGGSYIFRVGVKRYASASS
jgi:ABC-2 type transport system permease protein